MVHPQQVRPDPRRPETGPATGPPAERSRRMPGRVPVDRIRPVVVEPPDPDVVRRFLDLPDMACAVADAVVALAAGDVGRGRLRPCRPGARVCGPAVTLRYRESEAEPEQRVLGDRDLYGLAPVGGVAVIDAQDHGGHAVVGDVSAAWAGLAGVAGVVVSGAVRDLEALASSPVAVWCSHVAPRNARGVLDAVELNGPVVLDGARVEPADLVVADANGVAVVRAPRVREVLEFCERARTAEEAVVRSLGASPDLETFVASCRHDVA